MKDDSLLLTVEQAAGLLQISRDKAYELVKTNDLPHVRFGRLIRVPRFGLERWIAQEAGLLPESAPPSPAPNARPHPPKH